MSKHHKEYFTFSICREPRERFVSAWNHFHGEEGNLDIEVFLRLTESFLSQNPSRLYLTLPINETRFNYIDLSELAEDDHFEYPFRSNNTGYHLLPQVYFLQAGVDFLGRLETIHDDFEWITQKIFGTPLALPHANLQTTRFVRSGA